MTAENKGCGGIGMIPLKQIRARAKQIGLTDFEGLGKGDLIRAIQKKEGNDSCFDAPWCNICRREDCCWSKDCKSVGIGY